MDYFIYPAATTKPMRAKWRAAKFACANGWACRKG
jgi:hypothetical protein